MQKTLTPDMHHSRLVEAILYELREYGPHALLGIVATLLEDRDRPDGKADPVECDQIAAHLRRQFGV